MHERHRTRSPIQPYVEGEEPQRDLLRKDALDRYLFHLSRHTGRRVDASVAEEEQQFVRSHPSVHCQDRVENRGNRFPFPTGDQGLKDVDAHHHALRVIGCFAEDGIARVCMAEN